MVDISDGSREESGAEVIAVTNPATSETIDLVPLAAAGLVTEMLHRGRAARKYWAHTRLADRHFIYLKFVDSLRKEAKELASLLTAETGRPIAAAQQEIADTAAYFSDTIGESSAFYGRVYPHGAESITASFLQYTVNEPLGLVAVVMDDEAPALSFAYQVASALMAGNTIILASSPATPLTVRRLVQLLHESGVPETALQWFVPDDTTREHLVGSPEIHGLNVHGDSEVAIRSTVAARRNLTRVVALGHSDDAVIVFSDADLDLAVTEVARASFAQAGQNRAAPKRVIVERSVRESFTAKLVTSVRKLKVGDPALEDTQVGPVLSTTSAERVLGQIQAACEAGSRLLTGGTHEGTFVQPTVLDGTGSAHAQQFHETIRGPVVTVHEFVTEAEAFALAEDSLYGIGVGVFTTDLQRIGRAMRIAGSVIVINGAGDYRGRRTPYGGIKKSGVGTESLLASPAATTEVKTILAADIYEFSAANEDNPVGRHT